MNTSKYALLKTKGLTHQVPFVHTKQEWPPVMLDDPAISVLVDFTKHPPYSTTEDTYIQTALQQMKILKVRSLFVLDAHDRILGHIAARDIQGPKAAMVAGQYGVKPSEVTVKMLMIPCENMVTLQFGELSNARVGHIVRLFHDLSVNYIYVVDHDQSDVEVMRGMFSISRLSQQLGENMTGDFSSHSVAEMTHMM